MTDSVPSETNRVRAGQEGMGPMACPLNARVMADKRKMLLARGTCSALPWGKTPRANLTLIRPSLQKPS